MKILAFLLVLIAGGLGYKYYTEKFPSRSHVPVELTEAQKRSIQRQELETKIITLREELVVELDKFNEGIAYNGQSGYKVDIHGRRKKYVTYLGNRTQHSFDKSQPETADWITGPDFGLRRAQELRTEIRDAQAALTRLK